MVELNNYTPYTQWETMQPLRNTEAALYTLIWGDLHCVWRKIKVWQSTHRVGVEWVVGTNLLLPCLSPQPCPMPACTFTAPETAPVSGCAP